RVIASLVELGLVERAPHPTDGRQIIVTLSDAGHALIADETHAREAWMNERLSGLDEAQLKTLRDAVGIITSIVADSE
ncbi:MarR family winged helix-turn-helix transcriptional regulator, partial [Rhodococcus sp. LB1]